MSKKIKAIIYRKAIQKFICKQTYHANTPTSDIWVMAHILISYTIQINSYC